MKNHRAQDEFNARQIARSTAFTAHFRAGPFEAYTVECDSIEAARAAAAELNAKHGEYGRRANVYAVNPEGLTFHIS